MAESAAQASIELTAVDKASATLAAVKGKADELSKSADSIKSAWSSGLMDGFTKGPALAAVGIMGAIATAAVGAGAYLVHLAKGAAESQAGLKSLSEVTGATVEGLSAIRTVAKRSGIDLESVGSAMQKLAKNTITGGDDIARAYKAIGLSQDEMKNKSTDEQFLAIAKALDKYKDGAEKTAWAQVAMGKAGAQMLPLLKDLAENGDLVVTVTAAQAREADDLEKNMRRLSAAQEAWKKVLGTALVPVLGDVVKVMLDVQTETGGMNAQAKQLSSDGTLRKWAEGAAIGVAYVIDMLQGLWGLIKSVGIFLGGWAAAAVEMFSGIAEAGIAIIKGNYSALPGIVKGMAASVTNIAKMAGQDIVTAMTPTLMSDRLKTQFEKSAAGIGTAMDGAKDKIKGLEKPTEAAADKVNALEKALSELMNKLNNPDVDTEWVKQTQLLTKALQVGAIGWVTYADAIVKSTAQSKTVIDMNKAIADSLKVNEDIIDKNRQAIEDASRAMVEGNKELAQEIAGLGLSKVARELYQLSIKKEIDLRRINATATGEERDMRLAELDSLYAVREELIKNKDQVEQNVSVWQSFSSTTTDFLTNLIQNGRSAFGDLYNQAKKFAAQLIAIFAQKYILGMEVQGGGGVAGGVLNMLMGGGGAGAGVGSSILSSVGSALGMTISAPMVALAAAAAALNYGVGKLIGGGYSIGKYGTGGNLGLLMGGVVGGLFARAFGRKLVDSGIQADIGTQGISNAQTYAFEKGGWFRSDKTSYGVLDSASLASLEQARAGITGALKSVATALGIGTDEFNAFTYSLKVSLKGLSDADAQTAITKAFDEMARGMAKTLNFGPVSARVQAAVQSWTGSADELITYLNGFVQVFQVVQAAQQAAADIMVGSATDVSNALESQRNDVLYSYNAQTKAAQALYNIAPDSADALGRVASGMSSFRSAAVAMLVQIEQVRGAVSDMFGETIRSLQLSILSPEDQYKFLQSEADRLLAQALASSDPLQIQNLLGKLNGDVNQAMGLLSADQKATLVPEQIARLQEINAQISDHLNSIKDNTNANLAAVTQKLADTLPAIMQSMLDAAAKNGAAADTQLAAATATRNEVITVNVVDKTVDVQTSLVGG